MARVRTSVKKWTLDEKAEWQIKWEDFDRKLEHGMNLACLGGGDEEYSRVNEEVREFPKAAKMFWKQRAKVKWMMDGDTCTKFFFNWVKGRAGRNHIHGLKGEVGQWCYEEEMVCSEFQRTFKDLYRASWDGLEVRDRSSFDHVLAHINHFVSHDEVDHLDKPFTAKEVRGSVFQMGAFKAPGPDGIPACFYQKCWSMIKDEFTSAVGFLGIGFAQIWFSPEAGKAYYELCYYSEL
ncbi:uncharacterized protein LOC141627932 [Silene latifolia]|uniref:uncharacterized protein LOC141627932 n=1 Tax=Silene latifolia TaxID=37657 RepID=UPI003D7764F1